MNNLGVSLSDYANGIHDGQVLHDNANVSTEQLAELSKALEAGSITGRDTADNTNASGAPLKVESLENTLKVLTYKESDIQFWKRVPKLAAYNTVEEFNQLTSYGTEAGVFNNEGELPREEDSQYVRKAEIVKFMGVTKSVSHPMQLVRTHIGSAIQQEIKNGTLYLLRKADRALAFSDSSIVPQEFNGYIAQQKNAFATLDNYFTSDNLIDMRGKALTETSIENGALAIISNFGQANLLMAPPIVLSDFVKRFYSLKAIPSHSPAQSDGIMGQRVNKFQSQFGEIELGYDIFLNANPPRKITDNSISPQAPANVAGNLTATVVQDSSSKFDYSDTYSQEGDYYYAIASKNRFGESKLTPLNNNSLVSVYYGQAVDLDFTVGGGVNPATGFVVYRSKVNPTGTIEQTELYPIFEVSLSNYSTGFDGAAPYQIRDKNRYIPGTQKAILLQSDEEVYSFKQLAPLMKMDLATLAPATRFMILMYGTPMLYAPKKMVTYINIGRDLS